MTDDRRFEILGSAGRLINSSLDLGSVLERVIDSIIEATGAERGFVMLAADGTDDLEMRVARNVDGKLLDSPSFQISQNVVKQVQQSGEPAVVNDAMNDPRFESFQSVVELELRSILCVPLIARDRVIGVVYLDNRIRRGLVRQSDLDLATAIADLSAVAIENASLYGSLDRRIRELQELKEYQDSVFRSVSSAVISIDRQGRLTSLNAAAIDLLQLGGRSAEDELYTSVFGEQLSNRLLPLVARATGLKGEPIRQLDLNLDISRIAFSPNGSILAVGSYDGAVELWRVADWTRMGSLLAESDEILSIAVSPDRKLVAAAGDAGAVFVFDLENRGELMASINAHEDSVADLEFSPDGKFILTASDDGSLVISSLESGESVIRHEDFPGRPMSVAVNFDATIVAVGLTDGLVALIEPESGDLLGEIPGHSSSVLAVAFSADGSVGASVSSGGTLAIWKPDEVIEAG